MNLKRILIFVIVTTFLIYSISGIVVSIIAIRGAQADVASELSTIVSTSVADIVTESLKLGSFVEARNRIQTFINNGLFVCADLIHEGLPVAKCNFDKKKLKSFEARLKITERAGLNNPTLITYVDQEKLESSALKRSLIVIIFVVCFGLVFLLLLIGILKIFTSEILTISDEISANDGSSARVSFISEMNILRSKMREYVHLKENEIRSQTLLLISTQVAHDIRSPLSALNMITATIDTSEDRRELIKGALQRINDIADSVLSLNRDVSKSIEATTAESIVIKTKHETIELNTLIAAIVEEKRLEYKDFKKFKILSDLSTESKMLSTANGSVLMRVISNLINNSVEATSTKGDVTVGTRAYDAVNVITIMDNGIGMSEDLLKSIGTMGFTSGKENGNGLGIFSAKKSIEDFGGSFEIQSRLNVGTLITIKLPATNGRI